MVRYLRAIIGQIGDPTLPVAAAREDGEEGDNNEYYIISTGLFIY